MAAPGGIWFRSSPPKVGRTPRVSGPSRPEYCAACSARLHRETIANQLAPHEAQAAFVSRISLGSLARRLLTVRELIALHPSPIQRKSPANDADLPHAQCGPLRHETAASPGPRHTSSSRRKDSVPPRTTDDCLRAMARVALCNAVFVAMKPNAAVAVQEVQRAASEEVPAEVNVRVPSTSGCIRHEPVDVPKSARNVSERSSPKTADSPRTHPSTRRG
jgi:hypothetical protein